MRGFSVAGSADCGETAKVHLAHVALLKFPFVCLPALFSVRFPVVAAQVITCSSCSPARMFSSRPLQAVLALQPPRAWPWRMLIDLWAMQAQQLLYTIPWQGCLATCLSALPGNVDDCMGIPSSELLSVHPVNHFCAPTHRLDKQDDLRTVSQPI